MADNRDVIILGGGLVGSAQALALAAHGVTSHVIDRIDTATTIAPGFDGRVSAIASSSLAMFDAIGIGAELRRNGCPMDRIAVSDQRRPGTLEFAPDAGEDALGLMVENRLLRRALHDALPTRSEITVTMPATIVKQERDAVGARVTLGDQRVLGGRLLIVAEGRESATRKAAGITVATWKYDSIALVTAITHERPHGNVASQIFYPTGPFALLPMQDNEAGQHRSAVVWSLPKGEASAWAKLSDRALEAELTRAMGGMLGNVRIFAPRFSYPLGFHHTARITSERLVLVGDAGHGMHPIAGQGLNVGLRDVAALTEVIVDGMRTGLDPADPQLLARYERWRGVDALAVSVATDGLNRLFGIPGTLPSAARRMGLSLVGRATPLRGRFIAEARGTSGKLPKLLQGMTV